MQSHLFSSKGGISVPGSVGVVYIVLSRLVSSCLFLDDSVSLSCVSAAVVFFGFFLRGGVLGGIVCNRGEKGRGNRIEG